MNPFIAATRLYNYVWALGTHERNVARLLKTPRRTVHSHYSEIMKSSFTKEIAQSIGKRNSLMDLSMLSVLRAPTLYVICRIVKPSTIVETGVGNGFSSAFILNALAQNQGGHLYSIDLPNQSGQEIYKNRKPGWVIPESLKKRWDLIIGDSRKELTPLLERLKKINVFYHDSDHSYANMTYEFNLAHTHLAQHSLLISDDITDNNAFKEFCLSHPYPHAELFKLGVITIDK